jgi:hypothetical protein
MSCALSYELARTGSILYINLDSVLIFPGFACRSTLLCTGGYIPGINSTQSCDSTTLSCPRWPGSLGECPWFRYGMRKYRKESLVPNSSNEYSTRTTADTCTSGAGGAGVVCPADNPHAAYCAGASLKLNIIIRCINGCPQPGNCNDKYISLS